jgi:hypothetical protein
MIDILKEFNEKIFSDGKIKVKKKSVPVFILKKIFLPKNVENEFKKFPIFFRNSEIKTLFFFHKTSILLLFVFWNLLFFLKNNFTKIMEHEKKTAKIDLFIL